MLSAGKLEGKRSLRRSRCWGGGGDIIEMDLADTRWGGIN
jgi:hypothetical protein